MRESHAQCVKVGISGKGWHSSCDQVLDMLSEAPQVGLNTMTINQRTHNMCVLLDCVMII